MAPGVQAATSILIPLLVTIAAALQFALARLQLRTADPEEMSARLAAQPPVTIPVQLAKPPILQALDVLSSLRSHHLTDGHPCAPRLIIQPVDASGRPIDPNAESSGSRRLGTTHALVREPLQFSQAKIRQSVKDPRSLRWEENAALHEASSDAGRRPSIESTASSDGGGKGSSLINGRDVHDFITANYGSSLRYAEESAQSAASQGPRALSLRSVAMSVLLSQAPNAKNTHGLALPLEPPLVDEVKGLLHTASSRGSAAWEFDAFRLARATNDHALLFLGFHLMKAEGLAEHFAVTDAALLTFLERVETSYRDNPYHNRTHAADILQASFWIINASDDADGEPPSLLSSRRAASAPSVLGDEAAASFDRGSAAANLHFKGKAAGAAGAAGSAGAGHGHHQQLRSLVEPADVFALIVAAMAHDMDHTGQNNAFHVSTSTDLAIVYNDKSVLENHHSARLFQLLQDPACDIFAALSVTQRREVRDAVVAMILGTDMAVHFKNVDRLSAAISAGSFDLSNKDDKTFVLEIVLHSADIANPCRPERIYRLWTEKVMEEFYNQGDAEKAASIPVSKFFDRDTPNVPRCQVGFINFIVMPLYSALAELLEVSLLVDHLKKNLAVMELECSSTT